MATVLAIHAAPADVPLLTGGTIARLADAGHRVVVVLLTGEAPGGLADGLGIARLETLGYPLELEAESAVPLNEATGRILELVGDDRPELILGYNSIGVVHEPTHVRAHEIAHALANELGAPSVEAALPRELIDRGVQLAKTLRKEVPLEESQIAQFPSKDDLAYDIKAGKAFDRKWSAMQAVGGGADRFSRLLARGLAFPKLVVGQLFKNEHFGTGVGEAPAFFTELAK